MQFADPQSMSTAYLVLRQLYDGDIIDWPIDEAHPQRAIFAALEAQGLVARWDRVWPLSDRYRLTEQGIAAIEAVYRPAGAESIWEDLRRRNLSPADRRAYLQAQNLDPILWPLLHDPSTHWSTFDSMGSRYGTYVWEDARPPRLLRSHRRKSGGGGAFKGIGGSRGVHHDDHLRPVLVDLDQQAHDPGALAPERPDLDVS